MADLFDPRAEPPAGVLLAWALARSMSASVRPAPKAPIFRKLRRDTPSQNCWAEPRRFNIFDPPYVKCWCFHNEPILFRDSFGCKTNFHLFLIMTIRIR